MATGAGQRPSLEVVCLHPRDAEAAQTGGADRVHLARISDDVCYAVEPAAASAVVRSVDLPVRVTLRLSDGFTTQGGELTRLAGLVADYLSIGVEGFTFGFLTADLEVDADVSAALADSLGGARWTFDDTVDRALDLRRAWRSLRHLPGLDGVRSAGSPLGLTAGLDDLLGQVRGDPEFATALEAVADGAPEAVPWLVRAGVRRFHLGAAVRPGGSWDKAFVDAAFVRSWRLLLDDAAAGFAPAAASVPASAG